MSCTASSLPIIGLGLVERAIRARKHRPMFIVDLAVPRDVEPEVARLDDVYVYTVDDLGKIVRSGSESRQAAVAQAEAIIETRVRDFEALVAGARRRAGDPGPARRAPMRCARSSSSAPAGCWRAAMRPTPCSSSCRRR